MIFLKQYVCIVCQPQDLSFLAFFALILDDLISHIQDKFINIYQIPFDIVLLMMS